MNGLVLISRYFPPGAFFLVVLFMSVTCIAAETPAGETPEIDDISYRLEEAVGLVNAGLLCHAEKKLTALSPVQSNRKGMASFLLGRIYAEQGLHEKAEEQLLKAAGEYPLLKDYALKLLAGIYIESEDHEKVIETVNEIRNGLLMKFVMQSHLASLRALDRHDEVREIFFTYTQTYPDDWEYKLDLASFLAGRGETDLAIIQYKDVYAGGGRIAEDALDALKSLKADTFSSEEKLKRADNLFRQHRYSEAEPAYKEVLSVLDGDEKKRVMFAIGMCQFRQKRYRDSAGSFSSYTTPKWMYWHARSFYRINNKEGFARVKNDFEKRYPDNRRLALLYLMEADELRRQGNLLLAQKSYEVVASRFPKNAEEALWGLGWMYYSAGNFEKSLEYFSRLTEYERSRDYHKYLYWNARSQERMSEDGEDDFFQELPSDRSYYGYMIKMRSPVDEISESILPSVPVFPKGEQYQRINALAVMGMKDEAVLEITESIKKARSPEEFLYLGHMAMKLDAYKDVIYIAEPRNDLEFLPYSYPRAYWETIKHAAGSEGVDEHLVAALIREESRYDPDVVSWAGAVGLMQLLPATAKRMNNGVTVHTGGSLVLSDVRTNIMLGTHYLSRLVREFKEIPFAVAAYNAGENALRRWLNKYYRRDVAEFIENIPYKETRRYVKKVLKSYWQYRTISGLQLSGIGDDEPLVIDEGSGLAQLTPDPAP
jgi:soluble lytic murein transglycosylase